MLLLGLGLELGSAKTLERPAWKVVVVFEIPSPRLLCMACKGHGDVKMLLKEGVVRVCVWGGGGGRTGEVGQDKTKENSQA